MNEFELLVKDYLALKSEFRRFKKEASELISKQTTVIENQYVAIEEIHKQLNKLTQFPEKPSNGPTHH